MPELLCFHIHSFGESMFLKVFHQANVKKLMKLIFSLLSSLLLFSLLKLKNLRILFAWNEILVQFNVNSQVWIDRRRVALCGVQKALFVHSPKFLSMILRSETLAWLMRNFAFTINSSSGPSQEPIARLFSFDHCLVLETATW